MRTPMLVMSIVLVACGPEVTSFRTTDTSDPARPGAALVTVENGVTVAIWSNGGYVGTSDEPMTHVGFEVRNTSAEPAVFEGGGLALTVLGKHGETLPIVKFVAVTPLGPADVSVPARSTTALDSYFMLPVRPRAVDTMRVHWSVRIEGASHDQTTSFVRDDGYPVLDVTPAPST